jgi:glucose-6-phosphate-specific signal transduction histidine kinase
LVGLRDRVEALAGTIEIDSPPGAGTRVGAAIPVPFFASGREDLPANDAQEQAQ